MQREVINKKTSKHEKTENMKLRTVMKESRQQFWRKHTSFKLEMKPITHIFSHFGPSCSQREKNSNIYIERNEFNLKTLEWLFEAGSEAISYPEFWVEISKKSEKSWELEVIKYKRMDETI